MFLRCLEHERIMFGMFSICFEPRNSCRSHPLPIFVDFQQQYVKIGFFKLKKCCWTHVIQNPLCRFVCVCRTWDDVRLRALTLRYVLNIYIMGVGSLEKFLRPRKGPGLSFFRLGPLTLPKSTNFLESKKWILVVKMTWKKFFLNVSKVFGTWKNNVWDVFNLYRAPEQL